MNIEKGRLRASKQLSVTYRPPLRTLGSLSRFACASRSADAGVHGRVPAFDFSMPLSLTNGASPPLLPEVVSTPFGLTFVEPFSVITFLLLLLLLSPWDLPASLHGCLSVSMRCGYSAFHF